MLTVDQVALIMQTSFPYLNPNAIRENERVEVKLHTQFQPRNYMDRSGKVRVPVTLLPTPKESDS
jgi:hypothetical protein